MKNSHATSVLGTPEFMAPQLYEEHYDQGVDIYAFGMCLLEMVTLETPYRECWNPAQVYKKVSQGVKPQSLDRIADQKVRDFISWCLSCEKDRPTSRQLLQSEFLTDLEGDENNEVVKLFPPIPLPKMPMNTLTSTRQPPSNIVTAKPNLPAAPSVKPLQSTANFPKTPPSEDSTQGSQKITKTSKVTASLSNGGDNFPLRQSRFEDITSKSEISGNSNLQTGQKKEFNLIELSPEPRGQKEQSVQGKVMNSFSHLRGPSLSSDADVLDIKKLEEGAEADIEVISDGDDQNEKEAGQIKVEEDELVEVKEEDQDKVEIAVHFENKEGVQQILFPFDLETDSPQAVAKQMVQELGLKKVQERKIAQEIAKQVDEQIKVKQNDQQIQAQTACRAKLVEELSEIETRVQQISILLAKLDQASLVKWEESGEGTTLEKLKDLVEWKQKYEVAGKVETRFPSVSK